MKNQKSCKVGKLIRRSEAHLLAQVVATIGGHGSLNSRRTGGEMADGTNTAVTERRMLVLFLLTQFADKGYPAIDVDKQVGMAYQYVNSMLAYEQREKERSIPEATADVSTIDGEANFGGGVNSSFKKV